MSVEFVEDLISKKSWQRAGETIAEGDAWRTPVTIVEGGPALLYTFHDEACGDRCAEAHRYEMGAQLFIVPERLDAGPRWLLTETIDGVNLATLGSAEFVDELPPPMAESVVEGVGTALRKLHMLTVSGYGDISGSGAPYLTFSGWAAARLERFAEVIRERGFDDEIVSKLSTTIGELRHEMSAYHPRTQAGLSHGRLHLEHLWVDEETHTQLVGLTGFTHLASLPRELDVAQVLWIEGIGSSDALIRKFYAAYGAARTMDVQRRERFYRRLAALLSLSGEHGPSPRSDEELIALTER